MTSSGVNLVQCVYDIRSPNERIKKEQKLKRKFVIQMIVDREEKTKQTHHNL